jgi:hypothetical protein
MLIQGPININVVDNSDSHSRELEITFTSEFQALNINARIDDFENHITQLKQGINAIDEVSEQQGMTAILQICEELLPHIKADEIPLSETIAIEIGQSSPFDQILASATLK